MISPLAVADFRWVLRRPEWRDHAPAHGRWRRAAFVRRRAGRERVEFVFEADPAQAFDGGGFGVVGSGEQKREFYVFERGERKQQLEELKNEPDFVAAELGEAGVAQGGSEFAGETHLSCSREIHRAAEIEQGGFAASAATEKGSYLPRDAVERDTTQGFDTSGVDLRYIAN
jgi:hypothetical protein